MRFLRRFLLVALVVCAGVLLLYRLKDPERRVLDAATRPGAPGVSRA